MTTHTYNTDPIEKLYGVVKQKGYYTRSLDEFKTKYSTPDAIDNLYNVVSKSQLYTKSKDEFLNQYFPQTTKKKVGGIGLPSEAQSTSKTEESVLVPLDVDVEKVEREKLRYEAANNPKMQLTEEEIQVDPIKAANRVIHNKITNLKTPQATAASTYVKPPMETQLAEPEKRFTYSDAKKDIDRLNKDFFSSKEQIDQYLINNQDKGDDNLTKQLALKRKNDFDKLEGALHGASSLDEAALRYAANNGDQSIKYLLDQGGGNLIGETEETSNVPMSVRGEKLLQLLSNNDFRTLVAKNQNLKTEFNEAIANFPNRYPQYASRLLGEAIARKRDEKGLNNKFANIVSKETTDEIVKELFESGDFPTNYQFVYEKEIRPKLGTWQSIGRGFGQAVGLGQVVNDAPIPTSGFLESAGQSFENVYTSTAKTLADLSMAGSQSALDAARTEPQQVADVLKKQAETPQFEPTKFWDKVASHSGGLAGFVSGLGGGTGALKAINLIKNPAMASTVMMVLGTHGDTQDKAKIYAPNDKMTQFIYTGAMDGLNAALGKFLPGTQIPRLLSKGEGSVAEVLKKMVSGDISTGVAKDKVLQWFGDSIKGTLHGAEFMGAISAADDVLSQVLQGKNLNLDQSLESGWEGFKVGLMATPVLSMTQAALKVNRGLRDQVLSIADNPEYYKELAKKDPSIKEHLEDITENIDHVANVAKEAETLELSNKVKQDYILNSLAHKIKTQQAKSTTNEALKEKYTKEAKNIKERQTAIINGVSEDKVKLNQATKDVKELYEEDLLPRGFRSMIEKIEPKKEGKSEPKFDDRKVKQFLEFIGQQANNLDAEGKFNKGSDVRKSHGIPEVLIEIANDIFPEFKKTAEEADLKSETPTIETIEVEQTKVSPTEQAKAGREIFDQKLPEEVNPYKEPPKEVIDVVTGKGIVDKFGNPASIRSSINLMKKRFDTLDELIKKCL